VTAHEDRVAAEHATELHLSDTFTRYGLDDPEGKAAATMRWLRDRGWRVLPELAREQAPARRADPAVQAAAMAEIRAALAKAGQR
jgi:hypothetical protein